LSELYITADQKLGEGSFGKVATYQNIETSQEVAVKVGFVKLCSFVIINVVVSKLGFVNLCTLLLINVVILLLFIAGQLLLIIYLV